MNFTLLDPWPFGLGKAPGSYAWGFVFGEMEVLSDF